MTDSERGRDAARAVWGSTPAGHRFAAGAEPGSREYFDTARAWRTAHDVPWQYALIPFAEWRGRDVLEVGCGAGFDAHEIARHGARYTGIDIAPENVARTQRQFELADLPGTVLEADAEALPFGDASFDVVFSSGVLHHVPSIERALSEAARVLRPGGELWLLVYHRDSLFNRVTLPWTGGRLEDIEDTTSSSEPIVNVYSRSEVRRLLEAAGLAVAGMWIRKLNAEDLPRRLAWLARIPRLERLAGWYVIARARR